MTNVVYGTTIYKVTTDFKIDSDQEIQVSDISGCLDATYGCYKVEANVLGTVELEGKEFDAYYAVYDAETDTTRYYMLYDAEHMMVSGTEMKHVSAMIPSEDIVPGKEYIVNIVLLDRTDGLSYGSSCEGELLRVE